jgi:hypothetical protein
MVLALPSPECTHTAVRARVPHGDARHCTARPSHDCMYCCVPALIVPQRRTPLCDGALCCARLHVARLRLWLFGCARDATAPVVRVVQCDLIESIAGDCVHSCTVSTPQVLRVWYVRAPVAAQLCTPHENCPPPCARSYCCATVFATVLTCSPLREVAALTVEWPRDPSHDRVHRCAIALMIARE